MRPSSSTARSRRPTHKLLRYADQPDWTEVFDLVADPYETKNLAKDPTQAETRKKLETEHERLATSLNYRIPASVPKATAPPPVALKTGWVFDCDLGKDAGNEVRNAPIVEGRDKAKARQFSGEGVIEVPRTEGLRCADTAFTIEVTLKVESKDGVILAHGGATNGFALFVKGGVPVFAVNAMNKPTSVTAKEGIVDRWVKLTATVAEGKLSLAVDEAVTETKLSGLIPREPNDGIQIGADLKSPVDADAARTRLTGKIERVRIHRGVLPPR